jgi:hypothetical protein
MESQARGGVRWGRFGLVMVPSVAATAAIGLALAQGALAASFAVSGQEFKVTADRLEGDGFVQYGSIVRPSGEGTEPVSISAFDNATITNLCQSVVIPGVPFLGEVTMELSAGTDPNNPVEAENLFIDLAQLDASQAVFSNIDIGVSVDDTTKGPDPTGDTLPGSFAQQADSVVLQNIEQTAWATSAGTFRLSDLHMGLHVGEEECF